MTAPHLRPWPVALAACVALALVGAGVTAQQAGVGPGTASPQGTATPSRPPSAIPATLGTGAISGVIIDGATNAPVADAMVALETGGAALQGLQTRQLTDSKGRFAFVNLAASDVYTIAASKAGYLDAGYTRLDAFSTPISLKDGEWFSGARVVMWRPGAISGFVSDEQGEALAGVFVRVLASVQIAGRQQWATGPLITTDDRGAYRFDGLQPGRYVIEVPNVQSTVPATASPALISGVAFWTQTNAQSTGRPADAVPVETALDLDPRARLMVGKYPTPPPPVDGRRMAYGPAFAPSAATIAQATVVELKHGEERSGIDVRLEPQLVATIVGTVEGPAGTAANLTLRLVPASLEDLGLGSETATALVGTDGSFVFLNVPAGNYIIDAPFAMSEFTFGNDVLSMMESPRLPSWPGTNGSGSSSGGVPTAPPWLSFKRQNNRSGQGAHYWVHQPVTVSGSEEVRVAVSLRPGSHAAGRFIIEFDPSQPNAKAPTSTRAEFDPASGSPHMGVVRGDFDPNADPTFFETSDLMPGSYLLQPFLYPAGWVVKSITSDGRDFTRTPFDTSSGASFDHIVITITNAGGVVSGAVRDAAGAPVANATVVVFPVEREQWSNYGLNPDRIKVAGASNTGLFRLPPLQAGDYFVVAVEGATPSVWHDPEFFPAASAVATRVSVNYGDKKTLDLKLSDVKRRGGGL